MTRRHTFAAAALLASLGACQQAEPPVDESANPNAGELTLPVSIMIHIPLVITAALIPLLGHPLLYLPIHIVVLELLIHPAAILGFQQAAPDGLDDARRRVGGFFSGAQVTVILATGSLITLGVAGLFIWAEGRGAAPEQARAMAVVALIVALLTLLTALSRLRGGAPMTIAAAALLFAILASSIPALAATLHLHPLAAREWLLSGAIGGLAALTGLLFHFERGSGNVRRL